jgi:hypothetical protein
MAPLHLLYDVKPTVLTLVKAGANRKRIFLMKEEDRAPEDKLIELPSTGRLICKAEDGADWSYFYCVVAEPGNLENAGVGDGAGSGVDDMWRDEVEIRKAAHYFAKSDRLVTGLHSTVEPYGSVVENAIAMTDFTVVDPTGNAQVIKKGSWYVGIEPTQEGRVAIENGDFTGLSLEGTGMRQRIEKADEQVDEAKTLWKRLGQALGLHGPTGSVEQQDSDQEDDDVADNAKLDAVATEVEEIKKAQGAATTAIEGLVGTVNNLIERIDTKKKDEEDEEVTPADLKKSLDEAIDGFADKIQNLSKSIDKLAEGGSSQDHTDDRQKIKKSDEPLAGLLD